MEIFILSVWLLRTVFGILEITYYWQLKEYRWDRMKEFLATQGGRRIFVNIYQLIFLISVFVYIFFIYFPNSEGLLAQYFAAFISIIFLAESLKYLHKLIQRHLKRPRLTLKAFLIFALSIGLELLLLYFIFIQRGISYELNDLVFVIIILTLLDHDINAVAVLLVNYFARYFKRRTFRKARKIRLNYPDLKVIGITGSYGKTSVKEFLSWILEKDFKVLKTQKNTNTEMGIAKTIINGLNQEHQIFVCEMGAYKPGEIKMCCYIAHPCLGIFTGLNQQHLALFGSLENTFTAKWELISYLKNEDLAVFNGDSRDLLDRLQPSRAEQIICKSRDVQNADIYAARDIEVKADSLSFSYKKHKFHAGLTGDFQIINLMMAIVVAERLGMSLKNIAERVKELKAPEKTMNLIEIDRGYIIDDSYNVNPDGLRAAAKHLEKFEDYIKVLIFPGILELGEYSNEIHIDLAKEIAPSIDYAFFTDENFFTALSLGSLGGGLTRGHIFELTDMQAITTAIEGLKKTHEGKKFVFLFESRGADKVMEALRPTNP